MPMMQFSVAPWRILDDEHHDAIKQSVTTRARYTDLIMELAEEAAQTGEPIVRSMEYVFPHAGFAEVQDQFMLGDDVLVAPVVESGATTRQVRLPEGRWRAVDGTAHVGPREIEVEAGIDVLPYFERVP